MHYYTRSHRTTDEDCPRARYWWSCYGDHGIEAVGEAFELSYGTLVHAALAGIMDPAGQQSLDDLVANGVEALEILLHDQAELTRLELKALFEGHVRGFARVVAPRLKDAYDVVSIEREFPKDMGMGMRLGVKPDLILRRKFDGTLWYVEYKTTKNVSKEWMESWATNVQLQAGCVLVGEELGEPVEGCIIQGLYKGYCLASDTRTLTADLRWVPVGELRRGDALAAFDEYPVGHTATGKATQRQWRRAVVEEVGRTQLPCYRLVFEDGTTVVCSADHQWLTGYERINSGQVAWRRTEDLVAYSGKRGRGHRVLKLVEPWADDTRLSTRDQGYLAGVFDGEASVVQAYGTNGRVNWLTFSQNPGPVLDHVCTLLQQGGYAFTSSQHKKEQACHHVLVCRKLDVMRFLGQIRPLRLMPKFSLDLMGGVHACKPPVKLVDKIFVGLQEVVTLQTSTRTLIANGLASHNSYKGEYRSPLVYRWRKPGLPGQPDEVVPERPAKWAGWHREGNWEREGVKAWLDTFPQSVLEEQFPQTPPIFINKELIEAWLRQSLIREVDIRNATRMLKKEGLSEDVRLSIMDTAFPQTFSRCRPAWGHRCKYFDACWLAHIQDDPIGSGMYRERVFHHEGEGVGHGD